MKDLRNVLACIGAFVLATLHIQGKPMLVLLLFSFLFAHFICGYTYTWKNFKSALREHGVSILLVFGIPFITLFIALYPFTLRPSGIEIWRDGFFYYFLVGCIEELMCRGLLLEAFLRWSKRPFFAIVLSSLFYGLFHIPSIFGQVPILVLMRIFWSIGFGLYMGSLYVETKNILFVALVHAIADWATILFLFSNQNSYPAWAGAIILLVYLFLGFSSIVPFLEEKA